MRTPRIKAKIFYGIVNLKKDEKPQNTRCCICKKVCVDEQRKLFKQCDRITRSTSVWKKEIKNISFIIYETYRCMPLLGDEKMHAPDWEQHIVRYHIVFVKNNYRLTS